MARGRGRGRMRFRARPPPSVRSSMQELGLSANANYGITVSDALGEQVDAARAYFPALEFGPAPALKPTEKERELITRFEEIRAALRASPAAVRRRGPRQSSLAKELYRARAFFGPGSDDGEAAPRENLWDMDHPWLVAEMLPQELRKVKTGVSQQANGRNAEPARIGDLAVQADEGAEEGDVEDKERADKDKEMDPEVGALVESEEEDLELNADYGTGAHFDDDDGYEEADSGKEEALF